VKIQDLIDELRRLPAQADIGVEINALDWQEGAEDEGCAVLDVGKVQQTNAAYDGVAYKITLAPL